MAASLKVTFGYHTERGAREINQDFCGSLVPEESLLTTKGAAFLIADGVSGREAGGEASEFAVKNFINDYFSTPESWTVKTSGGKILGAANAWLFNEGRKRNTTRPELLTTLSVLVLKSTTAHIFHVGDCRVYRFREGIPEILTNDHRLRISRNKAHLTRALGGDSRVEVDYRTVSYQAGDCFLLTSDGVHEHLDKPRLVATMTQGCPGAEATARLLCRRAAANGSPDNLTSLVIRIDKTPSQAADDLYQTLTELPFPPELAPGLTMDGYQIVREIYASSRSQLYLAKDEKSGNQVVIKTPSVNFRDDPDYLERFHHEAWAGRRIRNPHVMQILEPEGRQQFLYLVMEYLQGKTLRLWMDKHPQPEITEVSDLLDQIAAGLQAFHRLEMVHRDLKPENILIDNQGRVKIIDFGSTRIAGIMEIATPLARSELQGTRHYTAPEYQHGHPGTGASDIFSLGVIAYEMLTGHLPSSRKTAPVKAGDGRDKAPYISALNYNPMVPLWMDGALARAIHPDPSQRYPELSEFIHDFAHPNPCFMKPGPLPLLEQNPLAFWRAAALIMAAINLLLWYWVLVF